MSESKRTAVASIMQESNTFSPVGTRYDDFAPVFGKTALEKHRGKLTEMGGFLATLERAGVEPAPVRRVGDHGRTHAARGFRALVRRLRAGACETGARRCALAIAAWRADGRGRRRRRRTPARSGA
ncbi:MAG: M81 family metallopeptidase [Bryobacterales bacterium]